MSQPRASHSALAHLSAMAGRRVVAWGSALCLPPPSAGRVAAVPDHPVAPAAPASLCPPQGTLLVYTRSCLWLRACSQHRPSPGIVRPVGCRCLAWGSNCMACADSWHEGTGSGAEDELTRLSVRGWGRLHSSHPDWSVIVLSPLQEPPRRSAAWCWREAGFPFSFLPRLPLAGQHWMEGRLGAATGPGDGVQPRRRATSPARCPIPAVPHPFPGGASH